MRFRSLNKDACFNVNSFIHCKLFHVFSQCILFTEIVFSCCIYHCNNQELTVKIHLYEWHISRYQSSSFVVMLEILFTYYINPFKPSVLFVGQKQTVKTQMRRQIRFSTVCLQNVLSKFEYK